MTEDAPMAETTGPVALALHGGAGVVRGRDYQKQLRHMSGVIELGRDRLAAGATALDVVVEVVAALAYFVMPMDAIPDMLVGVGYTDDAAVIATVLALVSRHIKPRHTDAAEGFLDRLARDA